MDASGAILSCSGGHPRFTQLGTEGFNSPLHQRACTFFANPSMHRPSPDDPYCTKCEFSELPADIDVPQVAHYLRAAGRSLFNSAAIELLSDWKTP